ncbi:succinylglutamate-semialdehyde dehydrogenase [Sessilibacter corallicola]|uniref:succinylglutamate-semialdehyde dehydrogenase n=1 Tax=Sessilibacter corallicola TaxID=2904075 RepID=UPI001E4C319B|nr:succinylglutamate-semialdehyde dehydrogenase [Sessilibacter corallicola]MCE2028321.1 succinylglutamate-semialdehyde dehydrogenase [Sessilibacter corallicola]
MTVSANNTELQSCELLERSEITGEVFIGGMWCLGDSSPIESVDPLTGMSYWNGASCSTNQLNQAINAACNAFIDWSMTDIEYRIELCQRFAELLKSSSNDLAALIHLETGKPVWECATEAASMIGKVDLSINAYHQRTGVIEADKGEFKTQLSHRAHGAIAVLGPYNFPGHLPNGHIVPALIAGNTIIFKPSEFTPAVGEFMVRLWQKAGLPNGVVNLVQGGGDVGEALSSHSGIKGLLFTGSSKTGERIHQSFAHAPNKILALEMGGNNPLVVGSVSDIKSAVYTIIQSAFISAGQRCTCARRLILIESGTNKKLLRELSAACEKLVIGGSDDSYYGPVISRSAANRVLAFQSQLETLGAKAVVTSQMVDNHSAVLTPGIWDVSDADGILDEECFGPILQVYWASDLHSAITLANDTKYGLSSGLISDDKKQWQYFYPRARAGIINWNRPLTGASGSAPFGGIGASGNHRPSAFYAADYCAYPVASMLSEHIALPEKLLPGVSL